MPLMVGKRKSPEKGLKLRIQVACWATEMVMTPVVAAAPAVWPDEPLVAVVAVASVLPPAAGAVVAVASAGAVVAPAGAVVAGASPPHALRISEQTTNNGTSSCSLERKLTRF